MTSSDWTTWRKIWNLRARRESITCVASVRRYTTRKISNLNKKDSDVYQIVYLRFCSIPYRMYSLPTVHSRKSVWVISIILSFIQSSRCFAVYITETEMIIIIVMILIINCLRLNSKHLSLNPCISICRILLCSLQRYRRIAMSHIVVFSIRFSWYLSYRYSQIEQTLSLS